MSDLESNSIELNSLEPNSSEQNAPEQNAPEQKITEQASSEENVSEQKNAEQISSEPNASESESNDSKAEKPEPKDSKAKKSKSNDSKDESSEANDSKAKKSESIDSKAEKSESNDSKAKKSESKAKKSESNDSKDESPEANDSKAKKSESNDPKPNGFESIAGMPKELIASLARLNITAPTPVQTQAIPKALEGRDILASAQTGTGKTAAFGIPLITHLMNNPEGLALVMTPTRELANQVLTQLQSIMGRQANIASALLIGGAPMSKQLRDLKRSPRLIVGTPGRIYDHLDRGCLKLDNTSFLVLDETDRMLDMGFTIQIDSIIEYMDSQRQTLLFSATLPRNIIGIAGKYLNNPCRVEIATSKPSENIKQEVIHLKSNEKHPRLLSELEAREGSIIIFVKTKIGAKNLADQLYRAGHQAEAIHGDLRQHKRDKVIAGFRKYKFRILVATDVAARGLDIPHIEHVINYDLPQCAEDYIHRIGRTARAGATGSAICFVTPDVSRKWSAIDRMMNPGKPRDRSEGSRSRSFDDKPYKRREGQGFKRRSDGNGFSDRRESFGSRNRDDQNFNKRGDDQQFNRRGGDERPNRRGDDQQFNRRGNDDQRFNRRGDDQQFNRRGNDDQRSNRRGDDQQFNRRGNDDQRSNRRGDDQQFNRRGDDQRFSRRGDDQGFNKKSDDSFFKNKRPVKQVRKTETA